VTEKPKHRSRREHAEGRPTLVGWLIILILVLAVIGFFAVIRAVL